MEKILFFEELYSNRVKTLLIKQLNYKTKVKTFEKYWTGI